jgi:hypothetical protein
VFLLLTLQTRVDQATVVILGTQEDELTPQTRSLADQKLKQIQFTYRKLYPSLYFATYFFVSLNSGADFNLLRTHIQGRSFR